MLRPRQYEISVQATAAVDEIRTETFDDRDHLVVPIVALVEGVLWPSNAPFPELALANEFGRHPSGWDGRPVVLDHPQVDGIPVSANSPDVLAAESFGMLFNTKIDSGKLKTEAWIDIARVATLSQDVQDSVTRLQSGEVVEVSTGLFMSLELNEGTHDGEEYSGIWRDIVPDHLAILPEGTIGACSVADGCGSPRINAEHEAPVLRTMRIADCADGVCIASPVEVRASTPTKADDDSEQGVFQRLMTKFSDVMSFRDASDKISDVDSRTAIYQTLRGTTDEYFWIIALFSSSFVYEQGWNGIMYQRDYTISDDGMVTLSDEVTLVRPVTEFVPVTVANKEDSEMAVSKDKVDALIASATNTFTEDDREWLTEQEDARFSKLEALSTPAEPAEGEGDSSNSSTLKPTPINNASGDDEVSPEDFIAKAPVEMQEVLNAGLRMQRQAKKELVAGIISNERNEFTQEYLEGMNVEQLEMMSKLGNVPSFQSRSAPRLNEIHDTDDDQVEVMPEAFPVKAVG